MIGGMSSSRARAWVATTLGHGDHVVRAHAGGGARIAPGPPVGREAREQLEAQTLRPGAALAVGAGESPVGALERVATSTSGELAAELRRTLADARSGTPLVRALERMSDRTSLASVVRFTEGISVAMERGSPLADVLRAQAGDAREVGRRQLMETGGRKEVLMMVPVVFLILPVTVLFAIFPGLSVLRVGL